VDLLGRLSFVALIVVVFNHFDLIELDQHFQLHLIHVSLLLEDLFVLDNEIRPLGLQLLSQIAQVFLLSS